MTIEHIWAVTISAIVTGVVTYLFNYIKDQAKKHDEEQRKKDDILKELIDQNKELIEWRKEAEKEMKEMRHALREINEYSKMIKECGKIILKDRIIQSSRAYISHGSISIMARENIDKMFHWYSTLGGNGTCKACVEKVMKLPISDTLIDFE